MSPSATLAAPREVTPEAVKARYAELESALPAHDATADAWEAWFWRWNDYRIELGGEASRRYFRECQDTRDETAATAWRQFRELIYPIADATDGKLRAALLACLARPELEQRLGQQLFARLSLDDAGFTPENVALHVEEMEQVSHYDRLMGAASVVIDGETLTLVQVQSRLNDVDAARRQAAWTAMGRWFEVNGGAIHGILSDLVHLRDRQARQLGDANFIPLAYRRMGRTEYGPAEVATFREAVRQHVVPLTKTVREHQARDLGRPGLVHAADMMFFPGASLGAGAAPIGEQIARATTLFERLHPRFAAHFRRMAEEGLIDLENRPGKKPGAFAMSLEDEGRVAIFCNSTGAETDVSTLTHEMGHAVQGWESMWIRPLDLRTPTMDAAEVHSFGMEYLALKEIEAFFSPADAQKFRRLRLMSTLVRLPYMAMVDAFQHWLFERPSHTPAEREAAWAELWEAFMPGLDFADCPAQRTYRWMRQPHIFSSPFYYIDYAIAEVGALQLWRLAKQDHTAAMDAYLELCRLGGTKPLLSILGSVGLRSPFEPDALPPLVAAVREELGL